LTCLLHTLGIGRYRLAHGLVLEYIDTMWPLLLKTKSFAASAKGPAGFWRWLPSRCAICQDWPHAPLCEACISRFAQPQNRCQGCALPWANTGRRCPDCQAEPPPLDMCLAAVTYAWPWVDLIARFKFQQQAGWSHALATLMMSTPLADDVLDNADLVLPIPLSPQRLAFRGYNQSWELAQQLSPAKADVQLLLRTRDTPSQRLLPRHERLANLVGAFAVEPLRAAQLRGKRVVLVDDVMTSGASLHSAARMLRQAGATHISALVLARTESLAAQ
jgi:ComF family protein